MPDTSIPQMPPGDDQVKQDFIAARALAASPDPWTVLNAAYGQPPAAAGARAAPTVDPNQPIGARIVQAAVTVAPPPPSSFLARLGQAAGGGLVQSLKDLGASGDALSGKAAPGGAPPEDYARPLGWGDLLHPEDALTKAVYQVAHGAPVLASGVAGGALGSSIGPEGSLAGGALGAGAMSVAQTLGPFYASALKANPSDPGKAFDQALAQAGSAGAFSAAGWALFGLKPFAGAVRNLMFQAFGVQPAVAVAGKVADNAVTGAPLAQGTADVLPAAVIGTAGPALAHAGVAALTGSAAPAGAQASPASPEAVSEGAASAGAANEMPPPAAPPPTDGQPPAAAKDVAPPAPEQKPDPIPIGDARADPVAISPDVAKNALDYIDGKTGANPVKVNLATIGTDNIQDTLERVSSMLPGQGVQSHDQTTQLALSLGLQPDKLLAGYKGQQLDAAQTTAMRMMLDSSAEQLVQFAIKATDPTQATPEAQAQFMRAFATHQLIQQYFENARAEAGRTLNAYGMISRTSSDMSKAIADLITNAGGADEVPGWQAASPILATRRRLTRLLPPRAA